MRRYQPIGHRAATLSLSPRGTRADDAAQTPTGATPHCVRGRSVRSESSHRSRAQCCCPQAQNRPGGRRWASRAVERRFGQRGRNRGESDATAPPRRPPSRVGRHEPRRSCELLADACRADDLYAAVRDGSWDVVQVKVRVARFSCFRRRPRPDRSHAARSRPSSDTTLDVGTTRSRADLAADPPTRHRSQLTDFAQIAAVSTAVGAVVSTVLLAVAFALVLSFRGRRASGSSATTRSSSRTSRPAPTAVATFMPPKAWRRSRGSRARPRKNRHRPRPFAHRVVARTRRTRARRVDLPDSKHNRDVAGTFQVTCELLNGRGD